MVAHHCYVVKNEMSTMKLCGVTTLLDGKKRMRTMKLCGVTTLLYWKKSNENNEGLWRHNIVGWEVKEGVKLNFVVRHHCRMVMNK